jgi:hypothetical protein
MNKVKMERALHNTARAVIGHKYEDVIQNIEVKYVVLEDDPRAAVFWSASIGTLPIGETVFWSGKLDEVWLKNRLKIGFVFWLSLTHRIDAGSIARTISARERWPNLPLWIGIILTHIRKKKDVATTPG